MRYLNDPAPKRRSISVPVCLLGLLLLAVNTAIARADEDHPEETGVQQVRSSPARPDFPPVSDGPMQNFFPRLRGQAVTLEITTRVLEQDQTVIWNESHRKTTIPGQPIGIKLVGANVVVAAQFTPYTRRGAQKFLVAQGQIWMDIPGQGIQYYTSMQTIPMEFGEPIYFFPLGSLKDENSASIEVMLTLHPYEEE